MFVLWGRLPGACDSVLRPLCSSLVLPAIHTATSPISRHQPATHTTNSYCGIKRIFSKNVCSSSSLFSTGSRGKREKYMCWRGKCVWGAGKVRGISTTTPPCLFWEKDPKGGYGKKIDKSQKELIRDGLKELRTEMSKWKDEMNEKFEMDPIWVRPGDMDKVWVLDRQKALDEWVVTSDKDHGEGSSSATLTLSPTGHGLFSGYLSTEVPKDGKVKRAGYCNMRSMRPRRSFKREIYLNWMDYNTLELRVRGDGRSYLLAISCAGYFDVMWNDLYTYPLYTRGGPHWQLTRIPFSKFILTSKGRVQDKQAAIPLNKVVTLGISCGDRSNAPFRLEIDYIGIYKDPEHTETFAYEMYNQPKFMVGS